MGRIAGKGNRSTEVAALKTLRKLGIVGWRRHFHRVAGKPDFFFPESRLALFIDGCFWHGCPACARKIPSNRSKFWRDKLAKNRERDLKVVATLRRSGIAVIRVWEHELVSERWANRVIRRLQR
jgi:DNA mismatch endonuclease, patch repair protein